MVMMTVVTVVVVIVAVKYNICLGGNKTCIHRQHNHLHRKFHWIYLKATRTCEFSKIIG